MTNNLPFFRTPKKAAGKKFWYALQSAREEGLMAVALLLAAYFALHGQGADTPDLLVWVLVLIVQSIPYVAAVAMSFIAAGANLV